MGVPLPCGPSCCFLCSCPFLANPQGRGLSHSGSGNCALQMPQDPPLYFAYLLPHTWRYCPFPAARSSYKLPLWSSFFCSVTRVIVQRGKIPLRFPETQHAAPAAGSGPVPKAGQETALFRLTWCFVKLLEMGLRGACSTRLVCPRAPGQDKLYLNLS